MTKDEALNLALEALEDACGNRCNAEYNPCFQREAITAIKEALAQPEVFSKQNYLNGYCVGQSDLLAEQAEQEPVAWLITDEKINSLQVDSIQRLIDRARHAHMTDIKLRINGQDEWYEADWLKHLTRATSPQRTWVGLTDEEINSVRYKRDWTAPWTDMTFARAIEAKLKELNT